MKAAVDWTDEFAHHPEMTKRQKEVLGRAQDEQKNRQGTPAAPAR